jgi:hypothetical protein
LAHSFAFNPSRRGLLMAHNVALNPFCQGLLIEGEADINACATVMRAFDPKRTAVVHCGNGFDAGFSPYQSTRFSRYNAVP